MKTTRMVCHIWNAGDGEYCGVYNLRDSIIQDERFLSQVFEVEVPECPVALTDSKKLEKLIILGNVYFDGVTDKEQSLSDDKEHYDELMGLLKEYLKSASARYLASASSLTF